MLKLAESFAQHLDNNEFTKAQAMLAENCIYQFRGQTISGAENIIDCYQGSFDSVADQLDEIVFESRVEEISPQTYKMHFSDKITKNGNNFEHKCEQTIRFENERIVEIQHIDLPGETEKLNVFFKRHGVIRKPIPRLSFRKALPHEAKYLSDLALKSKSIYDYPPSYLENCREALTVTEEDIKNWPVVVLEDDKNILGFFALMHVRGENRLEHLWLDPSVVGKGVGRLIFPQIIFESEKLNWSSFRIVADPKAKGFYEKMGANTIGMTQSKISPDIFLPHMEYIIRDTNE